MQNCTACVIALPVLMSCLESVHAVNYANQRKDVLARQISCCGSHDAIIAPFGQNTFWGPYIQPNIRLYGIIIYGVWSKTAYFGPEHRIYDRIFTVCRMAECVWCNYA